MKARAIFEFDGTCTGCKMYNDPLDYCLLCDVVQWRKWDQDSPNTYRCFTERPDFCPLEVME